jgi:hypothetical protein
MHTIITEADLFEMLETKFRSGELACPIHLDRETIKFRPIIDKVIV